MKKLLPLSPARRSVAPATTSIRGRPSALVLTGIVTTQRCRRQPADRRQDRPAARRRRRRGQEGPAARRHHAGRADGGERLCLAERRRAGLAGSGKRSGPAFSGAADRRSNPAGRIDAAPPESQVMAAAADLENARLTFSRTENLSEQRRGVASRSSIRRARPTTRRGEARRAQAAGRSAARAAVALRASTAEQTAMRRSQVDDQPASAGGGQRAAHEGRRAPRVHRGEGADRRDRRHARRADRRSRQSRPAGRDAHQSRRSVGPRRRRGNLHRSRADRRHPHRPAARPATSGRARSSTAAPTRPSPRSATSAAPSATSRRSKCACASTTAIAGSPSA